MKPAPGVILPYRFAALDPWLLWLGAIIATGVAVRFLFG